ncbi:hypothetical protein [Sorangium sp. So ce233]|uniref:hypothetical protein n=1 Tax=Sorangium sp. So ce233 TaxID=3133290 RepID=UPI003F6146E5
MRLLYMLLMALVGCSALDEDTLKDQGAVMAGTLTEDQQLRLQQFAANRFAQGRISGRNGDIKIGTVECYADEDDKTPSVKYDYLVEDMYDCLLKTATDSYFDCAEKFIRERLEEFTSSHPVGEYPTCGHDYADIKWVPKYDPEDDPYYDPINHDLSDVLRAAIGWPEPPPPEIQAILVAAGLLGPIPLLCTMDLDGCPEHPLEPGVDREPGVKDDGGDR